jgi:excinuclease ABC subunit A
VRLSVNYDNAVAAVERSLRSDSERTRRLAQRFVITGPCSVCHGTRLRPEALASQLGGRNIAEISMLSLEGLRGFTASLPAGLPAELSRLTAGLLAELSGALMPLLDVGLDYLTLDRPGASLSTGERQRIELTSTVRASTTGMLYVLDEPSVGLHPSNVTGLLKMISAVAGNGNSVIVVEHERELIRSADWVIELGPGAGAQGGHVIAAPPVSWNPTLGRSSAPTWPARPAFPVTDPSALLTTGRSPSRSQISTTCMTSPLSFR